MALGSYMGVSFTVSDRRILTPSGLKGQGGSRVGNPQPNRGKGKEPVDCAQAAEIFV